MAELDNEWFAGLVGGEAIEAGNGLVASLLTHVLQETNKTQHLTMTTLKFIATRYMQFSALLTLGTHVQ